jgi:hypothetical protein
MPVVERIIIIKEGRSSRRIAAAIRPHDIRP